MKRNFARSPYLWAMVAVIVVVVVAWVGRENYQPVTTGSRAPDFTALTREGAEASLADYSGKVVLLNIWATWCPPCREEMPSMERLYKALDDDAFRIVAVSVDSGIGKVNDTGREGGDVWGFADEMGLTFTILHDPSARIQQIYQTTGVPETFLIGRDGIIYRKVAGGTMWDAPENQELVRRLLGG